MAAPATTQRVAPTGKRLMDGYKSTIAFARKSNVNFWEIEPQSPGVDGGDMVDTTTMLNSLWRTRNPRALMTLTEISEVAAYDPAVITDIVNDLINRNGSITYRFSDGSTIDFYGYLQKFVPQPAKEGEMPKADITIVPTNFDPANFVEAGPVVTSVSGT